MIILIDVFQAFRIPKSFPDYNHTALVMWLSLWGLFTIETLSSIVFYKEEKKVCKNRILIWIFYSVINLFKCNVEWCRWTVAISLSGQRRCDRNETNIARTQPQVEQIFFCTSQVYGWGAIRVSLIYILVRIAHLLIDWFCLYRTKVNPYRHWPCWCCLAIVCTTW